MTGTGDRKKLCETFKHAQQQGFEINHPVHIYLKSAETIVTPVIILPRFSFLSLKIINLLMSLLKRRPIGTYLLNSLIVFVPISIILEFLHGDPLWIFISSGLAIIPLAGWMGKATEHLAERLGEGIGGLLNATFGNAAELIIALFALSKGLEGVVKASVTGSIIGNILLVLGLSFFMGGVKFTKQVFNRTAASITATALTLGAIALVIPTIFHQVAAQVPVAQGGWTPEREQQLSLAIAVVLFL